MTIARVSTAAAVTAVVALPVTVGCVIGHAYPAATAALLLSAAAAACGWVLAGQHDTPAASTTIHPAEREGDRVSHTG